MRIAAAMYAAGVLTLYVAGAALLFAVTGQWRTPEVLATFAVIAAAIVWTVAKPPRAIVLALGTIGVCGAIAIRAEAAGAVLIVGIIGLAAYGLGDAAMRAIGVREIPAAERVAYALAVGAALIGYTTMALGASGLLAPVPIAGALALSLALTVGRPAGALRSVAPRAARWLTDARATPRLTLACGWAVLLFIGAIAPELQYDALSYHLALPRVWIDAGRIVDVPEQYQSSYYLLTEMSYTTAMVLGGQTAAKLVGLGLFAIGCLGLYGFWRDHAGDRVAANAGLLYATTPIVAWGATTTYADTTLATYVVLAATSAYRAVRSDSAGLTILAGLLAGLAIATKLTAAIAIVPISAMVVVLARPERRLRMASVFGGAAAVACGVWPLLRYAQTGNPVFPLLNGVFRSPLWPPVNTTLNLGEFGVGTGIVALATLPIRVSFDAQTFTEAMRGNVIGLGLLTLPLALPAIRGPGPARSFAILAIASVVAWAATAQQLRYLVPVLALLAPFAAFAVDRAPLVPTFRRVAPALTLVVAIANLPLFLGTFWNIPERVPLGVAAGVERREAFLDRLLPTYGALAWLTAQPDAKASRLILVSKDGGRGDDEDRLYAPGQVETFSSIRARDLFTTPDEDVASAWLREHGATHVLVDRDGLHDGLASAAISRAVFLRRIGSLVYARGPIELYVLRR